MECIQIQTENAKHAHQHARLVMDQLHQIAQHALMDFISPIAVISVSNVQLVAIHATDMENALLQRSLLQRTR